MTREQIKQEVNRAFKSDHNKERAVELILRLLARPWVKIEGPETLPPEMETVELCYEDDDWAGNNFYNYCDSFRSSEDGIATWFNLGAEEWFCSGYTFIAWRKKPEFVKYEP